jgi:MFS family permease
MVLFLNFKFDLDAGAAAIVIGTGMGVGALLAYPSGRMADRVGKKKMFVLGGYIAFIGTLLIPFGWVLAMAILFVAMRSLAFQVASPALRAMQADSVPAKVRGRMIGMLESMSNIGMVVGAPIGGLLWDAFHGRDLGMATFFDGTMIPFIVSGLVGLFTVSLVLLFVEERQLAASID